MKKRIFSFLIAILLVAVPTVNFIDISSNKFSANEDIDEGLSVLESLAAVSANDAQKAVDNAAKKYLQSNSPFAAKLAAEKSIKQIEKGKKTYRSVFKNVYFVGDSLMNGLAAYDILNANNLITQVSASLYHLEENLDNIISAMPPVLVLHYGINMISTNSTLLKNFINKYTTLIKQLKKKLPNTRIIVSLIFPVDRTVAKAERFGEINTYNKSLKKMCKSLKIEYLDTTPLLKEHKEFYGSDGIHLAKAFYDKYWLKFIMREMGIY